MIPTLNQFLVIVSFVIPFWLAFWWIERRGERAPDREKLLTLAIALVAAIILAAIALTQFGN